MPRIRTLKPDFWSDSKMVKLSPFARLLYIGSWNFALCDRGHLPDDVDDLKLKVLPADDVDAAALLDELVLSGRVVRRTTAEGRSYLHVVRLSDHQKVDGRWQPRCPYCAAETPPDPAEPHPTPPKLAEAPRTSPELPGEGKGGEGKVRERKGDARERVVPRCRKHLHDPTPPACGQCADARRDFQVAQAAQRQRERDGPKCRQHRGQPVDNCAPCLGERKGAA